MQGFVRLTEPSKIGADAVWSTASDHMIGRLTPLTRGQLHTRRFGELRDNRWVSSLNHQPIDLGSVITLNICPRISALPRPSSFSREPKGITIKTVGYESSRYCTAFGHRFWEDGDWNVVKKVLQRMLFISGFDRGNCPSLNELNHASLWGWILVYHIEVSVKTEFTISLTPSNNMNLHKTDGTIVNVLGHPPSCISEHTRRQVIMSMTASSELLTKRYQKGSIHWLVAEPVYPNNDCPESSAVLSIHGKMEL
jgi:hypothetical protein